MRTITRSVSIATALALLGVHGALAAPPNATEIGASWGASCNKQNKVPKGDKCATNENCPSCCLSKYNSCDSKYGRRSERLAQKCSDAFRTCLVTVSNPDLNPGPAAERFDFDLDADASFERTPSDAGEHPAVPVPSQVIEKKTTPPAKGLTPVTPESELKENR